MLTDIQIERWRQRWKEANADAVWVARNNKVEPKR
jgi:hypothetical protein